MEECYGKQAYKKDTRNEIFMNLIFSVYIALSSADVHPQLFTLMFGFN